MMSSQGQIDRVGSIDARLRVVSAVPELDAAGPGAPSRGFVAVPPDDTANRKNIFLLIQLRWIAVVGQIVTIAVVQFGFGIALPLWPMSMVLGALMLLNLVSLAWLRNRVDVSNHGLMMMLLLDVAALTIQLYLSG